MRYIVNYPEETLENKRGCNSANCPPSVKTTPYPAKGQAGVSVAKYSKQ